VRCTGAANSAALTPLLAARSRILDSTGVTVSALSALAAMLCAATIYLGIRARKEVQANPRIDADAQERPFVRSLGAGDAQC